MVAVNKWDLVPPGMVTKADVTTQIYERLPFLEHAPICFTSAVVGFGLRDLFDQVDLVAAEAQKRLQPGEVLSTLRQAVERRPMSSRGVALRVQSAQQVAIGPPTFADPRESAGPDPLLVRAVSDQLPAPFPQLRRLADPPALPQGGRAGRQAGPAGAAAGPEPVRAN